MPTIDIHKQDLEDLVGKKFTVKELWYIYIYDQKLKNKLKTIN